MKMCPLLSAGIAAVPPSNVADAQGNTRELSGAACQGDACALYIANPGGEGRCALALLPGMLGAVAAAVAARLGDDSTQH